MTDCYTQEIGRRQCTAVRRVHSPRRRQRLKTATRRRRRRPRPRHRIDGPTADGAPSLTVRRRRRKLQDRFANVLCLPTLPCRLEAVPISHATYIPYRQHGVSLPNFQLKDLSNLYYPLGNRVVSVLDSGAEGPGFKPQSRRCRVTVLGKLFTLIAPLFTKHAAKLVAALLRVAG